MDISFYTKITYEHKGYDDPFPRVVSISEPAWDLGGDRLMDMFYKIWVAAGYLPEGFTAQCENWVEENKLIEE